MATQNKERKKRVDWKPNGPEVSTLIPRVVDMITGHPELKLHDAFWNAQIELLPEDRRVGRETIRLAEARYGKLVEAEIGRRAEEKKAAQATPPRSDVMLPITSALHPANQPQPQVTTQGQEPFIPNLDISGMDPLTLMEAVTDGFARQFKQMLSEKYRMAHQEVLFEHMRQNAKMTVPAMPPAPAPREMQLAHQDEKGEKSLQLVGKVKVALVGDVRHDHRYFTKVQAGLEEAYEFIEITKLGDTPKVKDCKAVVITGSADGKVETAVRAIQTNARYYAGKAANQVNDSLKHEWRLHQKKSASTSTSAT